MKKDNYDKAHELSCEVQNLVSKDFDCISLEMLEAFIQAQTNDRNNLEEYVLHPYEYTDQENSIDDCDEDELD